MRIIRILGVVFDIPNEHDGALVFIQFDHSSLVDFAVFTTRDERDRQNQKDCQEKLLIPCHICLPLIRISSVCD